MQAFLDNFQDSPTHLGATKSPRHGSPAKFPTAISLVKLRQPATNHVFRPVPNQPAKIHCDRNGSHISGFGVPVPRTAPGLQGNAAQPSTATPPTPAASPYQQKRNWFPRSFFACPEQTHHRSIVVILVIVMAEQHRRIQTVQRVCAIRPQRSAGRLRPYSVFRSCSELYPSSIEPSSGCVQQRRKTLGWVSGACVTMDLW